MKTKKSKARLNANIGTWMPPLITVVLFSILLFFALQFTSFKKGQWEKDVRARLTEVLIAKKSKLEQALYSRIFYTKSIAAYVSLHPTVSLNEFNNLANELIKSDSVISSMALSPDCIIQAIFPLEGHEAALGLDLLAHPKRKEIVEKTIETHKTFVAGPVELIEGGRAFISYTPIFNKTTSSDTAFWGVTDIVIYETPLIAEVGLLTNEGGFLFALRGIDGSGDQGNIFWGEPSVFDNSPVKVFIELPFGSWAFAAIPANGWDDYADQDSMLLLLLIISAFIISFLIGLFTNAILKIRRNEKELQAIFNSMSSLVIEFNSEARYKKIAPTNHELLYKTEQELLGKTVFEVFDKELAKYFLDNITLCLRSKKLVVIEYPLLIDDNKKWFTARLGYKSENAVIFQAYDISEQKKREEELAVSEKNLKELNATKDRLFSIIAHDLKSPFNQILGFSEILNTEYDELSEAEKKQFIEIIHKGSGQTVWLIENLLQWAQTQRNIKSQHTEHIVLTKIVDETLVTFQQDALRKNITLITDIDKDIRVVSKLECCLPFFVI